MALDRLLAVNSKMRVAVLVNEFGAKNVDASFTQSRDDQTLSLTNGCASRSISAG
ncbi:MAG: hypothetical protein OXI01_12830 [Albidovulum sp.]|nr:hypothetical protein [Albidovulum sp.]